VHSGGEIQLIIGPMFSGKSTEMLRRIRRHGYAFQRCVVIKNAADTRRGTDGFISTHDLADQAEATSATTLLVSSAMQCKRTHRPIHKHRTSPSRLHVLSAVSPSSARQHLEPLSHFLVSPVLFVPIANHFTAASVRAARV